MEKLNFKQWLEMMGSTGAIYDGSKSSEDWNWQGAPGKVGVTPKQGPVKNSLKVKKHGGK